MLELFKTIGRILIFAVVGGIATGLFFITFGMIILLFKCFVLG